MIQMVDLHNAQAFDAFVTSNPNGHFMQTSAWGRVKADWEWIGLLAQEADGAIVGAMALLKRKLRFGGGCLLYAPRGPVWNPRDKKTFCELLTAAKTLAKDCGAYALRIDPAISEENAEFLSFVTQLGFSCNRATDFSLYQPRMCYLLDLKGHSPESLLAGYHRSTRYHVHLALRNDVTVRLGGEEDISIFCDMMAQTARKNGFEAPERSHLQAILRHADAKLYFAEHVGAPIAAAMMLVCGKQASFLYGCSYAETLRLHPNELLQYAMHCDALAAGCECFDFRGVEGYPLPENPKFGLHRYKQSFGAKFEAYVGQLDLIFKPKTAKLLRLYSACRACLRRHQNK